LVQSVYVIFIIVGLNHWGACCWFAAGLHAERERGRSWLDASTADGSLMLIEASSTYQYCTALLWSTSQMTFGSTEVHPQTVEEKVLNVAYLLVGVMCFSFLVSAFTASVVEALSSRQEARATMSSLRQFLSTSGLRTSLRMRVERHVANALSIKRKPLSVSEAVVLPSLSTVLRGELRCALCWGKITTHPLLKLAAVVDLYAMQRICGQWVDFLVLLSGETLFHVGAHAEHVYCVKSGELLYRWTPAGEIDAMDDHVPEATAWLCEAAFWTQWRCVGTATVETASTEILQLNADNFVTGLLKAPLLHDVVIEYGQLFHARLMMAVPPQSLLPNDLRVPGTTFHELLMMMHTDLRIYIGLVGVELLRKRRHLMFPSNVSHDRINELEHEVCAGRRVLTLNDAGEAESICVVTVIKMQDAFGKVFAELGQWSVDHRMQSQCRLPGLKQEAGEGPEATLKRLMKGKLSPLLPGISLGTAEESMELQASKHFGIPTRYMQNMRKAHFDPDVCPIRVLHLVKGQCLISHGIAEEQVEIAKNDGQKKKVRRLNTLRVSKARVEIPDEHPPVQADIYAVADGDSVSMFAWLTEAEMKFLTTTSGDHDLQLTLDSLCHEVEALYRLSSYGFRSTNLSPFDNTGPPDGAALMHGGGARSPSGNRSPAAAPCVPATMPTRIGSERRDSSERHRKSSKSSGASHDEVREKRTLRTARL